MGSKHGRKGKSSRKRASSAATAEPNEPSQPVSDQDEGGDGEPSAGTGVNESDITVRHTVPAFDHGTASEQQAEAVLEKTRSEGTLQFGVEPQPVAVVSVKDEAEVQPGGVLSTDQAKQIIERLLVAMLAANVSPTAILSRYRTEKVSLGVIRHLFESANEQIELEDAELVAIQHFVDAQTKPHGQALYDLGAAAAFRIEMLEFQIRSAVLAKARSKSGGKIDIQRAIVKLVSHLATDSETISSIDFEALLEETLAISACSLFARLVLSRMMRRPFNRVLPKLLEAGKTEFVAAFGTFVAAKPLSMDSVEGQLRYLVSQHQDLRQSFQALDIDGSGTVSLDEFIAFLEREARMKYPRDILATFIKRFDVDGDGTLSYDEFVDFVCPKQFGVNVLTPFGMFYHTAERNEPMKHVVAKIKTRMFWMQHNDLFSISNEPTGTAGAQATKEGKTRAAGKLKVTDRFVLTHHFGRLRLKFKPSDQISSVLKNGELVVLVLDNEVATPRATNGALQRDEDTSLPPFEYRLKPNTKRAIPTLLSWSLRDDAAPPAADVLRSHALAIGRPRPVDSGMGKSSKERKLRRTSISSTSHHDSERSMCHNASLSSVEKVPVQKFKRKGHSRSDVNVSKTASLDSTDTTNQVNRPAPLQRHQKGGMYLASPESSVQPPVQALPPSPASSSSAEYGFYEHLPESDADSDTFDALATGDESALPSGPGDLEEVISSHAGDAAVEGDEELPPPYE